METQPSNKLAENVSYSDEPWHAPLNKVTTVSKILAAVVFITLPFLGFWLGIGYGEQRVENKLGYPPILQIETEIENTVSVMAVQDQDKMTSTQGSAIDSEAKHGNTDTEYRPYHSSEYATYTRKECGELMAQQPMNQCTAELVNRKKDNIDVIARKINNEYLVVSKSIGEIATTSAEGKFIEAQKYWWMSVVATCEVAAVPNWGGSVYPLVFNSCLLDFIDDREIELEKMVEGSWS